MSPSGSLKYLLRSILFTVSCFQDCCGIPYVMIDCCGAIMTAMPVISAMASIPYMSLRVVLVGLNGCFLTFAYMQYVPVLFSSAV